MYVCTCSMQSRTIQFTLLQTTGRLLVRTTELIEWRVEE
jgi:hypothetical protein